MKKVTEITVEAFKNARNCKISNSQVRVEPSGNVYYRLFGNGIAMYSPRAKELMICDCKWQSQTTKERLNGILHEFGLGTIIQRNWTWYLVKSNGEESRRTGNYTFNL